MRTYQCVKRMFCYRSTDKSIPTGRRSSRCRRRAAVDIDIIAPEAKSESHVCDVGDAAMLRPGKVQWVRRL